MSELWSAPWRDVLAPQSVLTVLFGLSSIWLSLKALSAAGPRRERPGRFRRFWTIEQHLFPNRSVPPAWIGTNGKVPSDHFVSGSLISRIWGRGNALFLTPSAPKFAFATPSCERQPPSADGTSPLVVRLGGFWLKLRLHPSEHAKHLRRSIRWPAKDKQRTLAVCSADDLVKPAGIVDCYVVQTAHDSIKIGEDESGPFVQVRSADPLRTPDGNEWRTTVNDVPDDAIWLVACNDDEDGRAPQRTRRDWESPWRRRYLPLLRFLYRFLSPTVLAALILAGLHYLLLLIGASGDLAALLFTIVAIVGSVQVLFCISVVGAMLPSRCWDYWRYERRWGSSWTAGTTACVEDAELIRNGIEPEPSPTASAI